MRVGIRWRELMVMLKMVTVGVLGEVVRLVKKVEGEVLVWCENGILGSVEGGR